MKAEVKVTLIYLAIGITWILASDRVLLLLFDESQQQISFFQSAKGLFYVGFTAIILFLLIRRYYKTINQKVTELEIANAQLKKQTQQLKITNNELEQFSFVASHDLQEPLRTISSFLILLERRIKPSLDETSSQYIGFVLDSAKNMRQLVIDLLEFSRSGQLDETYSRVDVNKIMDDLETQFKDAMLIKNASIDRLDLPILEAQSASLFKVLECLVDNALKFAKNDVPLIIRVSAKREDKWWVFAVQDNGIGIEQEYHGKIFELFQRLHERDEFDGTGVGLAMTKRLVEKMEGKIWVDSTLGVGSTFYFRIPIK
jgi:two-component system CheB/CheR fusion protein